MDSRAQPKRDHGGGIDAAMASYGGTRAEWLDLSTGINPLPYPHTETIPDDWTALPDTGAVDTLLSAARRFWHVPDAAEIVAAPGASALIVQLPRLCEMGAFHIPEPTYNEHRAAFEMAGGREDTTATTQILVHPNNPDGRRWSEADVTDPNRRMTIVDESFCDVCPGESHIARTAKPGTIVLKSFGKFWGLAGLRLGFAIGTKDSLTTKDGTKTHLRDLLGPWAVSGPALRIATRALTDDAWATETRTNLAKASRRLDQLMSRHGASPVGGTDLFRLYEVGDAAAMHDRLARRHVLSRIFPYSKNWLRLGLPHPDRWDQLEEALAQ